jgi:hypothetical protein
LIVPERSLLPPPPPPVPPLSPQAATVIASAPVMASAPNLRELINSSESFACRADGRIGCAAVCYDAVTEL